MIIALNDNQEYVKAADAIKNQQFVCPGCKEKVILKSGDIKQKHFAHYAKSTCETFSENETTQHLAGKLQLAIYLQHFGDIKIEAVIPEINQRPDLLMQRGHRQIAIEYQCSPISQKKLDQRNAGYKSQNIHVIWILGNDYYVKNMTQTTILKFLMQGNLTFYLPNVEKFIHRTNFKKYDFERVSYIEKYSHQLFETVTVDDKLQINIQKQIYKLQNLLIQKRIDEKIVRYLYQRQRLLLNAPLWIHQGWHFGLSIPNWHWRMLSLLLIEYIGIGNVVHQDAFLTKLENYVLGDKEFKKQQSMSLLKEFVQKKYIVQKEQYILVKHVPLWYESIQEKLGKVRK
ncbi:competence protein [Leuconostoc gelidum subsp. gelidum]|uniref:competence protein CoiA n=1 Tax=Leuconostoc gelidum TaxID=1244 RepID=UPI001CC59908|nr:competence protein CoiA family protein [Leuconostoc gelidum]MBZ6014744.1 competence protein [Leuconostoc gelidum subsp. gelidum]